MSPVSLAPETREGLSAAPGPCAVQRRCWFSRSLCSLVQETDADRRTCVPRATAPVLSFCPVSRPDRVSAEPRKGTVRREGHRPQPGPSAVTRAPRPRPGIPVGLTPFPAQVRGADGMMGSSGNRGGVRRWCRSSAERSSGLSNPLLQIT